MTDNRLKLTKHQAAAVRTTITEINQITSVLQAKHLEFKRLTDMIQGDHDLDPDGFTVEGLAEEKGETFLKLTPRPKPEQQK